MGLGRSKGTTKMNIDRPARDWEGQVVPERIWEAKVFPHLILEIVFGLIIESLHLLDLGDVTPDKVDSVLAKLFLEVWTE